MIPESFIDKVVESTDLVDLLMRDANLPLKKSGAANWVCLCPFHSEKTPSFSVSETKQFYKCFGCGKSGNALSFLRDYMGLGFVDSVKYLADRLGWEVPQEARSGPYVGQEERAKRARIKLGAEEALAKARDFYAQSLALSDRARRYAQSRGLSEEAIERWGLGYAPSGRSPLRSVFERYPDPALRDAGLIVGEGDAARDRFRDRLMFPILDARGKIVGFGGRAIAQGQEPKYLNSPETPLFSKGKLLFGLKENLRAAREKGLILVVEGYMDVVGLSDRGVGYAVATLGTSATEDHLRALFRASDTVVFCFDGDAAGRKAAWRALNLALPTLVDGKTAKFLFLPKEHDPDSFTKAFGKAAFEKLLADEAMPLSECWARKILEGKDLSTQEGVAAAIKESAQGTAAVGAPILRSLMAQDFLRRVSELSGMDATALAQLLDRAEQEARARSGLPRGGMGSGRGGGMGPGANWGFDSGAPEGRIAADCQDGWRKDPGRGGLGAFSGAAGLGPRRNATGRGSGLATGARRGFRPGGATVPTALADKSNLARTQLKYLMAYPHLAGEVDLPAAADVGTDYDLLAWFAAILRQRGARDLSGLMAVLMEIEERGDKRGAALNELYAASADLRLGSAQYARADEAAFKDGLAKLRNLVLLRVERARNESRGMRLTRAEERRYNQIARRRKGAAQADEREGVGLAEGRSDLADPGGAAGSAALRADSPPNRDGEADDAPLRPTRVGGDDFGGLLAESDSAKDEFLSGFGSSAAAKSGAGLAKPEGVKPQGDRIDPDDGA